jgi:hypothetical protein
MTSMRLAAGVFAILFLTRCATMIHRAEETLHIDSTPSGANAHVSCGIEADVTTPADVRVPRKALPCSVTVSHAGHQTQTVNIERGIAPAFWLNMAGAIAAPLALNESFKHRGKAGLLGAVGLTGLLIDRVTGAMYAHEENRIRVTLQRN